MPETARPPAERLAEAFDEACRRSIDGIRLGEDARHTVLELEPSLRRACLGVQSGVVERERRLIGERIDEPSRVIVERTPGPKAETEDADDAAAREQRHRERGAIRSLLEARALGGPEANARIGKDVLRLHRDALGDRDGAQTHAARERQRIVVGRPRIACPGNRHQIVAVGELVDGGGGGIDQSADVVDDPCRDLTPVARLREETRAPREGVGGIRRKRMVVRLHGEPMLI